MRFSQLSCKSVLESQTTMIDTQKKDRGGGRQVDKVSRVRPMARHVRDSRYHRDLGFVSGANPVPENLKGFFGGTTVQISVRQPKIPTVCVPGDQIKTITTLIHIYLLDI